MPAKTYLEHFRQLQKFDSQFIYTRLAEFSSMGCRIRNIYLNINISKGNYWISRIGVMWRCQKLSIGLENEVIWKLIMSKNVKHKKCVCKLIFFNEKKLSKIWMIFDLENWRWKSNLSPSQCTNSQNSIIFFGYIDF